MLGVEVYGVILESHSYPREPAAKKTRNIMPQQLFRTATSRTNRVVANFYRKINDLCISRVNKTRVKLKGLYTGNQNPNVDTRKLAHMWGVGVENTKKTIMATTQNSVRYVTIPLTK